MKPNKTDLTVALIAKAFNTTGETVYRRLKGKIRHIQKLVYAFTFSQRKGGSSSLP
jgi:hypothetical protein